MKAREKALREKGILITMDSKNQVEVDIKGMDTIEILGLLEMVKVNYATMKLDTRIKDLERDSGRGGSSGH